MTFEPEPRIVLIPHMPPDMMLDLIFRTDKGIGVQVSEEEIEALQARNIPFIELFLSSNEYAVAMYQSGSRGEALALIERLEDTRLASLPPDKRGEFGVA